MNKKWSILIWLSLFMSMNMYAYNTEEQGSVAIDLGAGYQALLPHEDGIRVGLGTSMRLGIGYQYQYSNLLLRTGIEGQYGYMTHRLATQNDTVSYPVNGLNTVRVTSLNQREQVYRQVSVAVPLLIGVQMGSAYAMAGVKPGISVWGDARSSAHETTWLEYPVGTIIPGTTSDHLIKDDISDIYPMSMQWHLGVYGELGWRITPTSYYSRWAGTCSLWAEYGLLGQNTIAAGVKMTVLLHTRSNKQCRLCGLY